MVARRTAPKDWRALLAARAQDPAPALLMDELGERSMVPTRHVVGGPASERALARLRRLPRRLAASLEPVWSHADGARFCVLPGGDRCLVEIHAIDAMASETQSFHDSLLLDEDPHHLADALCIGGAPGCADHLVILTSGRPVGQVLHFDHESLRAEPLARSVEELIALIATDPLAVARLLGSHRGLGITGQATAIGYVADRREHRLH